MQNISSAWLYPLIVVAGALQALGPPMNGALRGCANEPMAGQAWCHSCLSLPCWACCCFASRARCRRRTGLAGCRGGPRWAGSSGAFAVIARVAVREQSRGGRFRGVSRLRRISSCRWPSTISVCSGWRSMPSTYGVVLGGLLMVAGIARGRDVLRWPTRPSSHGRLMP